MAGIFLRWLIPGVVAVGGGTALALAMTSAPIATDLATRAGQALDTGTLGWAAVRIEGRDAVLTGTATTRQMIDEATTRVATVHGIRGVTPDIVLAEFVSPFPFVATTKAGITTLAGGYPNADVHAAILAAAGEAADSTRLLSGAPDAAIFESGARFGLAALGHMDEGEISLADLSLTIVGRAKSLESLGDIEALRNAVPAGISLAALTIAPPLASPYIWRAHYDGTTLALSGNVPDERAEARFRLVPPANVAVSTSLVPASGEPSAFTDNAMELLKALLLLERGDAAIEDGAITLSGAPASSAVADEVTAAMARIGGIATLEPPRVADFGFAVDKSAAGLAFSGFVPDAATRDRLADLAGADVSGLALGRGAPERFASAVDFGLAALARLGEGRFELKGTRLSLGGRAASGADFEAIAAMVAEGAPQGLSLVVAELRPPMADPFVFTAVRDADGATTLSGYLPDAATRATLQPAIADLAADTTTPADGAPEAFAALAAKGLGVLALLDTGTLAYDGTAWSIAGAADSPLKAFAAGRAFAEAGLRPLGWGYEVRLPEPESVAALPIISPYVWRAQKTGEGAVSFTGFAPSDGFKRYLAVRAEGATDGTALGAGAPADFGAGAIAGLDALLALDEGALSLDGTRWTLTGEIADTATRDAIQTALAARIDAPNWQVSIQARDSAPVVTPYLWSASKADDGGIDVAGHVPDAALQGLAGTRDATTIASGEPAGFPDDLRAGLAALGHLQTGRAAFDGSRWVLSGAAATQEEGAAALAALAAGSRGGALWTTAISGYTPSAPSEPEPEIDASEAPAPESSASEEPAPAEAAVPAEPMPSEAPPIPPADERALDIVDPMPARFVFEASRESGQPIALSGSVPADAAAAYFGVIAGGVPTDGMRPQGGLPDNFITSAIAGIEALATLHEGRLGFDGRRWWLRGTAANAATRDAVSGAIATLATPTDWSVFVGVLAPIEICRESVAELERRNAITFRSGSAQLTETSLPVIDELAVDLAVCATASVHVEGHTDADGAEDLNLALSVERAEAVVAALIARGIGAERLYAEGYGESQPIASNATSEGKAQNRRIAFSIGED